MTRDAVHQLGGEATIALVEARRGEGVGERRGGEPLAGVDAAEHLAGHVTGGRGLAACG